MIHFKNKNGFTLIEVLFATVIMGLVLSALFATQATIFENMLKTQSHLTRIYAAENFMYDARMASQEKSPFTFEKKIEDPPTSFKYESTSSKKKSSLKNFNDLEFEQVTIEWQDLGKTKKKDTVVSFIYKPQPLQEKKKA
jgi:prepilin-type N-terminal cleavage/methylation domain-containing protein